jgi:beta-lactamase class A
MGVISVSELSPIELLEQRLRQLSASVDAEWSIYAHFTGGSEEIDIDADRQQDTMSLIKVPLLVALMRAVERGEADLNERIVLEDDHKRLGTGVLFLFERGASFTLLDAAWLMIVVSDNTATDLCLRSVGGPEAVNREMRALGLDNIVMTGDALSWFRALAGSMDPNLASISPGELVMRGYPFKTPASFSAARERFHFGDANRPFSLASARALGQLMLQVRDNRCASPESCGLMLRMLEGQQLQTMLPKYLWGVSCAHKTGNFPPFISSDLGLFTPPCGRDVVISIMTQRHRGQRALVEDTVARMGELIVHTAEGMSGSP